MSIKQISTLAKQESINGIDFYCEGEQIGMSQRGLARLVGVDDSAIRRLIDKVVRQLHGSESLKPFTEANIYCGIKTANSSKVLQSLFCSAVVKYYALEYKYGTQEAKYSLAKFSDMGMDNFIRRAVGAPEPSTDQSQLNQLVSLVLNLTGEVKIIREEQDKMKKATITSPGLTDYLERQAKLVEQNSFLIEGNQLVIDPIKLTLLEWLQDIRHISISDKKYRQLRLKVAETFKTHKMYKPRQENRVTVRGNSVKSYVYDAEVFPLLEVCLNQVLN